MTGTIAIVDFAAEHAEPFLALNETFVQWLSPLDPGQLDRGLARASYARCAVVPGTEAVLGGLIAYRHDVDLPGHRNMAWLRERLDAFVYIDRIIISPEAQGRGVGRRLYDDLAAFALSHNIPTLACEVNTAPDNPASHHFHQRSGFRTLGDRLDPGGEAAVRYYAKALPRV